MYKRQVIGIVGVYLSYHRKGILLPNFILYISAGILILLSLAALSPGDYVPEGALPLTLEVSMLIPMLILYMHKKRFINHFLKQIGSCNKRLYAQGAEAAVCLLYTSPVKGSIKDKFFILLPPQFINNKIPYKE